MNTLLAGWEPWKGEIAYRTNGAIVADRTGVSTTYALFNLQPRGKLFIGAQVEVYEGMVIGERAKSGDLDVNGTREKQLNNIRAAGKDEALVLAPPIDMSLEEALQWISDDELVEVTPSFIRIRKKVLAANQRPKRKKDAV
jgi:GTP-binding protein